LQIQSNSKTLHKQQTQYVQQQKWIDQMATYWTTLIVDVTLTTHGRFNLW